MKNILRTLLALYIVLPLMAVAQNNYMNDPMVRIAMATYDALLAENPQDYATLYLRGKDYYRYGDYNKALEDLNEAIRLYPRQETSDLSQAYTIRGLIYQMQGNTTLALADFNEALLLDPTSRYSLISRADLLVEMGDFTHAKEDYQMLIRRDARCQEAYLGLAIIAYKENNIGIYRENMQKAQDSNPTNVDFYLTRGAIYEEMGEWRLAADDYVSAMIYGDNRRAVAALNSLSAIAYQPTIEALSVAIEDTDEKGFYYFVRGAIHMNNHHYTASIQDWNTIVEQKYLHYHTVFYNRGYCYMRLGQFEYALEDISKAIRMKGDEMSYFLERSQIYRVLGQYDKANEDIAVASTFDMDNAEVLLQRAYLATEQRDYQSALNLYNEAIMYNADNTLLYLLRGDIYNLLGNTEAAQQNYEMMLNVPDEALGFESLHGFAMARLGRNIEAEMWIEQVMERIKGIPSGEDYYKAACIYALTGNNTQAYKYLEQALKAGYGDYFNYYFEYDSPISVAPLRNEPDFRSLIQSYNNVF